MKAFKNFTQRKLRKKLHDHSHSGTEQSSISHSESDSNAWDRSLVDIPHSLTSAKQTSQRYKKDEIYDTLNLDHQSAFQQKDKTYVDDSDEMGSTRQSSPNWSKQRTKQTKVQKTGAEICQRIDNFENAKYDLQYGISDEESLVSTNTMMTHEDQLTGRSDAVSTTADDEQMSMASNATCVLRRKVGGLSSTETSKQFSNARTSPALSHSPSCVFKKSAFHVSSSQTFSPGNDCCTLETSGDNRFVDVTTQTQRRSSNAYSKNVAISDRQKSVCHEETSTEPYWEKTVRSVETQVCEEMSGKTEQKCEQHNLSDQAMQKPPPGKMSLMIDLRNENHNLHHSPSIRHVRTDRLAERSRIPTTHTVQSSMEKLQQSTSKIGGRPKSKTFILNDQSSEEAKVIGKETLESNDIISVDECTIVIGKHISRSKKKRMAKIVQYKAERDVEQKTSLTEQSSTSETGKSSTDIVDDLQSVERLHNEQNLRFVNSLDRKSNRTEPEKITIDINKGELVSNKQLGNECSEIRIQEKLDKNETQRISPLKNMKEKNEIHNAVSTTTGTARPIAAARSEQKETADNVITDEEKQVCVKDCHQANESGSKNVKSNEIDSMQCRDLSPCKMSPLLRKERRSVRGWNKEGTSSEEECSHEHRQSTETKKVKRRKQKNNDRQDFERSRSSSSLVNECHSGMSRCQHRSALHSCRVPCCCRRRSWSSSCSCDDCRRSVQEKKINEQFSKRSPVEFFCHHDHRCRNSSYGKCEQRQLRKLFLSSSDKMRNVGSCRERNESRSPSQIRSGQTVPKSHQNQLIYGTTNFNVKHRSQSSNRPILPLQHRDRDHMTSGYLSHQKNNKRDSNFIRRSNNIMTSEISITKSRLEKNTHDEPKQIVCSNGRIIKSNENCMLLAENGLIQHKSKSLQESRTGATSLGSQSSNHAKVSWKPHERFNGSRNNIRNDTTVNNNYRSKSVMQDSRAVNASPENISRSSSIDRGGARKKQNEKWYRNYDSTCNAKSASRHYSPWRDSHLAAVEIRQRWDRLKERQSSVHKKPPAWRRHGNSVNEKIKQIKSSSVVRDTVHTKTANYSSERNARSRKTSIRRDRNCSAERGRRRLLEREEKQITQLMCGRAMSRGRGNFNHAEVRTGRKSLKDNPHQRRVVNDSSYSNDLTRDVRHERHQPHSSQRTRQSPANKNRQSFQDIKLKPGFIFEGSSQSKIQREHSMHGTSFSHLKSATRVFKTRSQSVDVGNTSNSFRQYTTRSGSLVPGIELQTRKESGSRSSFDSTSQINRLSTTIVDNQYNRSAQERINLQKVEDVRKKSQSMDQNFSKSQGVRKDSKDKNSRSNERIALGLVSKDNLPYPRDKQYKIKR